MASDKLLYEFSVEIRYNEHEVTPEHLKGVNPDQVKFLIESWLFNYLNVHVKPKHRPKVHHRARRKE